MDEALAKLRRRGHLIVPQQMSWRRAERLVKQGVAILRLFHNRWQGRLDLAEAERLERKNG